MPPIEPVVQYGLLGLFTYLVIWLTWWGFPRAMESHDNQINRSIDLAKTLVTECREERRELNEADIRARQDVIVRFEKIMDADRDARHKLANDFQRTIMEILHPEARGHAQRG